MKRQRSSATRSHKSINPSAAPNIAYDRVPKEPFLGLFFYESRGLSFHGAQPCKLKNSPLRFCDFFALRDYSDFFWERKNCHFIIVYIYFVSKNETLSWYQDQISHLLFIPFDIILCLGSIWNKTAYTNLSFHSFFNVIPYKFTGHGVPHIRY